MKQYVISNQAAVEMLKVKLSNYFKQFGDNLALDVALANGLIDRYINAMLVDIMDPNTLGPAQTMLVKEPSRATLVLMELAMPRQTAEFMELPVYKCLIDSISDAIPGVSFGDGNKYAFVSRNDGITVTTLC